MNSPSGPDIEPEVIIVCICVYCNRIMTPGLKSAHLSRFRTIRSGRPFRTAARLFVSSPRQLGLSSSCPLPGHVIIMATWSDWSCRRGNAVAMMADNGRLLTGGLSHSNGLVNVDWVCGWLLGWSKWIGNRLFHSLCFREKSHINNLTKRFIFFF